MVEITITYEGELRCRALHGPSGSVLETDAPTDNHGQGARFSPTDLVAAALGSCMLTVMGITARALQVDLTGTRLRVEKSMVVAPLRRIGQLTVEITVPTPVTDTQKQALEKAARTCPVHQSLHPDVVQTITFRWA